ncbi:MAG: aminodeoxychorismate/anthranilate synthase component II [Parashewanella sp.]
MKLFLLDNFDSFSYNLVDQFRCLDFDVVVYRNDLDADVIATKILSEPNAILILSPGPGSPIQAGCMMQLIGKVAGKAPILGICLGHQALVEHYGGKVDRAPTVVHGKAFPVHHNNHPVFANLPSPLPSARYHSLVAVDVPKQVNVIAHTDNLPMAMIHQNHASLGFQFHPESILTCRGSQLLTQAIEHLISMEVQS